MSMTKVLVMTARLAMDPPPERGNDFMHTQRPVTRSSLHHDTPADNHDSGAGGHPHLVWEKKTKKKNKEYQAFHMRHN